MPSSSFLLKNLCYCHGRVAENSVVGKKKKTQNSKPKLHLSISMDTRNANNFFSSSSSDHLPWLWVIETLANFKQVDTALLYDLITRVSELTDESWAETAKEILALKQLEDLFNEKSTTTTTTSISNELASSNVSRFEFNVSDRAQDVLHRLLQMMEMPNMRKLLLKFLKWDVSQFICKKRASLPKYDLHQLKNAILEGVDPAARSLRELSGLDKECEQIETIHVDGDDGPNVEVREGFGSDKQDQQETRIPINGGSPNADAVKLDQSMNDVEIQSPKENSCRGDPENGNQLLGEECDDFNSTRKESPEKYRQVKFLDDCRTGRVSISNAAENLGESLKDGQGHEINWDSDTLDSENEVEIVQETHPDCCLISRKRGRSDFSEVEVGLNLDTDALCMKADDHIPGVMDFEKNGKLNSMGQNSAPPLQRNKLVQDSSGSGLSSGGKEENELAKRKRVQDLQGNGISFDHGDGYDYHSLKRPKQGIGYGEIAYNQSPLPSNAGEIPQETALPAHLDGHHQKNFLDEAQNDSDPKEGRSGGNNEFDKPPSFNSDDEMVIAAEKRSFLSSQYTLNPDSETSAECVEQSFCVKCYKGGRLLTCNTSSCPVAVHENCLGPASLSSSGVFYCPFCSYLQAIVAYRETKKKAALTKEREALAKNHLVEFLCTVNAKKQTQSSERTLMKEQVESQMAGDNHLSNVDRGSRLHQQEAEVATDRINNGPTSSGAPTSPAIGRNDIRETRNDHREQVSSHKSKRVVEEEKCAEPCAIHRSDSLLQSNDDTSLNCENTRTVLPCQNRDNTEMDEEHQSVLTEEGKKGKAQLKSRSLSCGDVEAALVHDKHADAQQENEDSRLAIVPYRENYCKLNLISNESPEKQNDVGLFINVRRQLRFPTQYSNRIAPSSKREIIDWTAEEVEMLKEGVHNFTKEGEPCPWKTILEFGRHVFDKSRTRVDLKNKWNNICKKEGRRKR